MLLFGMNKSHSLCNQHSQSTYSFNMDDEPNIFLKAALTGKVSTAFPGGSKKPARNQRLNFSQAEDLLIETAYGHHKGNYREIVKFIVTHVDILPTNAQEYYKRSAESKKTCKAAEERVRKRVASKLLKTSR